MISKADLLLLSLLLALLLRLPLLLLFLFLLLSYRNKGGIELGSVREKTQQ